jgi:hypothetical protein
MPRHAAMEEFDERFQASRAVFAGAKLLAADAGEVENRNSGCGVENVLERPIDHAT